MTFLATIILSEGKGTTIVEGADITWDSITGTWETVTDAWIDIDEDSSLADTFRYNNKTMFYVENGSESSVTVTIPVVEENTFLSGTGSLIKNNIVAAVAAGTTAILDCRSISYRGNDGLVSVNYSANVNLIVAAIQIDRV